MTDDQGLFRAILDHPDDDLPRLAFADWLDENGPSAAAPWSEVDPSGLAAFIRKQVECARLPTDDPVWLKYLYRDEHNALGPSWFPELPALTKGLEWAPLRDILRPATAFRRGFPACVTSSDGRVFVSEADDLYHLAPIEAVAFLAIRQQEARPLAECEWLSRLARLEFLQGLSSEAARRLFESPHLTRLTQLYLGPDMTVIETARAVVRSPAFARLQTLSCRDDRRAGGSVVEELTRLADPPALRHVQFPGNRLNAERVARLVASPALSAVEELDLSDNNLGPEGVGAVALAGLSRLRALHLNRTWPRNDGILRLVRSSRANLRQLALEGNVLDASAAERLAEGSFANLRILTLADNRLGDAGAEHLAKSPLASKLLVLDLAENQIEDAGAVALAESPYLDEIIHLNLDRNAISRAAAGRLEQRFGARVSL